MTIDQEPRGNGWLWVLLDGEVPFEAGCSPVVGEPCELEELDEPDVEGLELWELLAAVDLFLEAISICRPRSMGLLLLVVFMRQSNT